MCQPRKAGFLLLISNLCQRLKIYNRTEQSTMFQVTQLTIICVIQLVFSSAVDLKLLSALHSQIEQKLLNLRMKIVSVITYQLLLVLKLVVLLLIPEGMVNITSYYLA
jgi:hypothetical protein